MGPRWLTRCGKTTSNNVRIRGRVKAEAFFPNRILGRNAQEKLDSLAAPHSECQRLMTMPGPGP